MQGEALPYFFKSEFFKLLLHSLEIRQAYGEIRSTFPSGIPKPLRHGKGLPRHRQGRAAAHQTKIGPRGHLFSISTTPKATASRSPMFASPSVVVAARLGRPNLGRPPILFQGERSFRPRFSRAQSSR